MFLLIRAIRLKKIKRQKAPKPAEMRVSFLDTVESGYLWNTNREAFNAVHAAFKALPPKLQHLLAFVPKDGEYIQRVQTWEAALKNANIPAPIQLEALHIIRKCYISIKVFTKGGLQHRGGKPEKT